MARQLGIHPSMSIAEARALLPALHILEHDPQEDLESLCWLADACQRFSPIVGLEALDKKLWMGRSLLEPQGLAIDASNLGILFGGETAMGTEVIEWFQQQGLLVSLAIADSLGAAWALANYGARHQISQRLLKYHETGVMEPLSPCVVSEDEAKVQVLGLPVEALRLDGETVHSLRRLGLRKVGDLLALPREGLATRLGSHLIHRIDQACLHHQEAIASLHMEPEFAIEQSIEYPTDHRETIEEILRRLTTTLCSRLAQRGRGALRVVSRLDLVQKPSLVMQLGLYRPVAEAKVLTPLLLGQLDQKWNSLPGKPSRRKQSSNVTSPNPTLQIHRVTLTATLVSELTWQQPDLFELDQVVHRESMAQLINVLSNRLGRRAVVAPQIHGDPQPELACNWRPLTGRRSDGKQQQTSRKFNRRPVAAEPRIGDPLRRPLSLVQPPSPIEILEHDSKGMPSCIRMNQLTYKIARSWGPERIETGWWRGPSQRRDYYRVETQDGAWLWLFRQINDGVWFLHGWFD